MLYLRTGIHDVPCSILPGLEGSRDGHRRSPGQCFSTALGGFCDRSTGHSPLFASIGGLTDLGFIGLFLRPIMLGLTLAAVQIYRENDGSRIVGPTDWDLPKPTT